VLAAVGRLITREGFSALGVNAIAREAGVDKVLIYRYFGTLDGLLDAWGRSLTPGAVSALGRGAPLPSSPGDRAAAFLLAYAREVRARPEVLEVMRWELVEDNAATRRLAEIREAAGLAELAAVGVPPEQADAIDLPALAAVLSAGVLHLALRAKTAPEWLGVPLRTDAGWARIERAAGALARAGLAAAARSGAAGGGRRTRRRRGETKAEPSAGGGRGRS
jgi:AcrR family transcriptional regulator